MNISLKPEHLKRYKDIAWLLIKYGRSDLVKTAGLDEAILEEDQKVSDDAPREAFLDWCERWAAQVRRVLKPDGSFFLNVGAAPANPWFPHEVVLRLRRLFILQNTLHW